MACAAGARGGATEGNRSQPKPTRGVRGGRGRVGSRARVTARRWWRVPDRRALPACCSQQHAAQPGTPPLAPRQSSPCVGAVRRLCSTAGGQAREDAVGADGGVPASAAVGQAGVFPAPQRLVRSTLTNAANTEPTPRRVTIRVGAVWAQRCAARSHAGWFERARRTRRCGDPQAAPSNTPSSAARTHTVACPAHRARFDRANSSRRCPRGVAGPGTALARVGFVRELASVGLVRACAAGHRAPAKYGARQVSEEL